jgi:hypothetical protein
MSTMECINCSAKLFQAKLIEVELPTIPPKRDFVMAWVCQSCEHPYMTDKQIQDYLDKYKGLK